MKVTSLFSGVGGLDLGLQNAGHVIIMQVESNPVAQQVLRSNFGEACLVPKVEGLLELPEETELLSVGFPCQDETNTTRPGTDDDKILLLGQVFRLLTHRKRKTNCKMPIVVMESVEDVLFATKNGPADGSPEGEDFPVLEYVLTQLEKLGYFWAYRTVSMQAFGLPQRRTRLILVAMVPPGDPRDTLLADLPDAEGHSGDCMCFICQRSRPTPNLVHCHGLNECREGGTDEMVELTKQNTQVMMVVAPKSKSKRVGTLSVVDTERLQGFPEDWTDACKRLAKRNALLSSKIATRDRKAVMGKAGTVQVGQWIGKTLLHPFEKKYRPHEGREDTPFLAHVSEDGLKSMPSVAYGFPCPPGEGQAVRRAVGWALNGDGQQAHPCATFPVLLPYQHLHQFLGTLGPAPDLHILSNFLRMTRGTCYQVPRPVQRILIRTMKLSPKMFLNNHETQDAADAEGMALEAEVGGDGFEAEENSLEAEENGLKAEENGVQEDAKGVEAEAADEMDEDFRGEKIVWACSRSKPKWWPAWLMRVSQCPENLKKKLKLKTGMEVVMYFDGMWEGVRKVKDYASHREECEVQSSKKKFRQACSQAWEAYNPLLDTSLAGPQKGTTFVEELETLPEENVDPVEPGQIEINTSPSSSKKNEALKPTMFVEEAETLTEENGDPVSPSQMEINTSPFSSTKSEALKGTLFVEESENLPEEDVDPVEPAQLQINTSPSSSEETGALESENLPEENVDTFEPAQIEINTSPSSSEKVEDPGPDETLPETIQTESESLALLQTMCQIFKLVQVEPDTLTDSTEDTEIQTREEMLPETAQPHQMGTDLPPVSAERDSGHAQAEEERLPKAMHADYQQPVSADALPLPEANEPEPMDTDAIPDSAEEEDGAPVSQGAPPHPSPLLDIPTLPLGRVLRKAAQNAHLAWDLSAVNVTGDGGSNPSVPKKKKPKAAASGLRKKGFSVAKRAPAPPTVTALAALPVPSGGPPHRLELGAGESLAPSEGAKKEVKRTSREVRQAIERKHLERLFTKSLKKAAEALGVCETTVKKICREKGILRWPGRTLQGMYCLQKWLKQCREEGADKPLEELATLIEDFEVGKKVRAEDHRKAVFEVYRWANNRGYRKKAIYALKDDETEHEE